MALFIYGTATNTGKGFFTAEDRRNFHLRGFPGNVWVIGNNEKGAYWLAEKNGVEKTKAEAQALVDAEVTAAQACLLYTSPSPRDGLLSRMPSSA